MIIIWETFSNVTINKLLLLYVRNILGKKWFLIKLISLSNSDYQNCQNFSSLILKCSCYFPLFLMVLVITLSSFIFQKSPQSQHLNMPTVMHKFNNLLKSVGLLICFKVTRGLLGRLRKQQCASGPFCPHGIKQKI